MARLFLTSDEAALARVKAGWGRAEMPTGATFRAGGVGVATARKRVHQHANALADGEDRWIVSVGTYAAFGGATQADALRELLDAFDHADPFGVRDLIFGHYTLAVRAGGRIRVFGAAAESYDALYWQDPDDPARFAIGTMLLDVMATAPGQFPISDLAAFKATYNGERGIAGPSAAPGIRALRGHEALVIETDPPRLRVEARVSRQRAPAAHPGSDPRGYVDDYLRRSRRVLSVLPGYGTIGLNLTGGIDSRMLAAEVAANGIEPVVLYGKGNSAMTNTRREDERIAWGIATVKGWPFVRMDWGQTVPHGAEARRALRARYGLKQLYGGTSGVARAMEGGIAPYPDLQIGAYTPPFTNHKPWERELPAYRIDALSEVLPGNTDVLRSPAARRAYRAELEGDLRELARVHGIRIEDGAVDREDYARLLIHVRRSKDAFNVVAFNQFGCYLAPYFTTELYDALTAVPVAVRRGDWFQLAVVEAVDPGLLDFPIFSYLAPFDVDRRTLTMTRRAAPKARALGRIKQAIEARLPLAVRRRLRTLRGRATGPKDHTWRFRAAMHRAVATGPGGETVCPARLCEEDLRVAYRYLNLLEAGREAAQPPT